MPIEQPVIGDGAVAVAGGRILAAGHFADIKRCYPEAPVKEYHNTILMPPLVNAHTHLELSHLEELGKEPSSDSFIGWVENLLETRLANPASESKIINCGRATLQDQYQQGVIAVADTGNMKNGWKIGAGFGGNYLFHHEYMGLMPAEIARQLTLLKDEDMARSCTGHASYSTGAPLLEALKHRAEINGQLFSIHVAETDVENQLVRTNSGPMRDFLEKRGVWHDSFESTGIDKSGAVQYLQQLDLLNAATLCIHCVHVSDAEIELLAGNRAKVCLCPGSNRFLGVGKAPVAKFLGASLLPALGTDSLASNPVLSIWNEMRLLAQDHPEVTPEAILSMATLGGAQALGLERDFGRLAQGMSARMLLVTMEESLKTPRQVLEFLVNSGTDICPRWLSEN